VTSEQSAVDSYSYDANGNMTCRIENGVTYTHTYNAENRASSIAKRSGDCATGTILESWSFAYDGDGTRVSTAHFTGTSGTPDSTTSYYMGGQFEVKDGATKKYYSIAGMMVAVNDGSAVQYLLTDHLGSTAAVTDSSGTLTSQQRYLPFGEERAIPNSPILATDFGYTGQRLLDSGMGGIMDYKARFYSPSLMRFIQPDTIIPDQFNPQSWNRFGYVTNNPVRFNDPTGHMLDEGDDGGCLLCEDDDPPPTNTPSPTPSNTPTPSPSNTPTPSPSNTPVPTPTGTSVLDESQILVQESEIGDMLWDWGVANGYSIAGYANTCIAHGGKNIVLNPCKSAVYNAGTIAHEIMHDLLFGGSTGSAQEEYLAFMIGDTVRAQLIAKGHGSPSDMAVDLKDYTVQLENNPNLDQDLIDWFELHGLDIYVRSKTPPSGTPTGYGLPPFPLTWTPKPSFTPTP